MRNIHQVEQGGRYMVGRAFWLPRGLSSWLLVTRKRRKRRDINDCATMHRHLHPFRHTALTGSMVVAGSHYLPIKPVDGRCSTWIWNSMIILNSNRMNASIIGKRKSDCNPITHWTHIIDDIDDAFIQAYRQWKDLKSK